MQSKDIDDLLESSQRVKRVGKLAFGVGVNDVSFKIGLRVNGKKINHRAYSAWLGMLERCYSEKKLNTRPTYTGCFVSEDWVYFSKFFEWWEVNHVDGWHLDKDLLCPGNKEYCSEKCLYIPQWLNSFTNDHGSKRGPLPIGVTFDNRSGRFKAAINLNGKSKNLGRFSNPESAHAAWFSAKLRLAQSYKSICDSIHPDLHAGVINKVVLIKINGSK